MKTWTDSLDATMRKQLCKDHCLINSIRSYNFKLLDELPPTPPAAAVNRNVDTPGFEPPKFDYGVDEPAAPSEELNSVPLDKIGSLAVAFRQQAVCLFSVSVRKFTKQCQINKTIENISASEDELKKSETAKKSTVVKWTADSEPTGPVMQELATTAAQQTANDKLRKTNNNVDALVQQIKALKSEIRKLKRAQRSKRKRDADDESVELKEPGGH
eukprot:scaffold26669_cov48-Cyclotella_meneghiniana.AAC.1